MRLLPTIRHYALRDLTGVAVLVVAIGGLLAVVMVPAIRMGPSRTSPLLVRDVKVIERTVHVLPSDCQGAYRWQAPTRADVLRAAECTDRDVLVSVEWQANGDVVRYAVKIDRTPAVPTPTMPVPPLRGLGVGG